VLRFCLGGMKERLAGLMTYIRAMDWTFRITGCKLELLKQLALFLEVLC